MNNRFLLLSAKYAVFLTHIPSDNIGNRRACDMMADIGAFGYSRVVWCTVSLLVKWLYPTKL